MKDKDGNEKPEVSRSGGREGKYRDSFEVTPDVTMDAAVRDANYHDPPKNNAPIV